MVAYRLMEGKRMEAAKRLFQFNMERYPGSWNVYDSMGEWELKRGNLEEAEQLYRRSLELNEGNVSGMRALEEIEKRRKH